MVCWKGNRGERPPVRKTYVRFAYGLDSGRFACLNFLKCKVGILLECSLLGPLLRSLFFVEYLTLSTGLCEGVAGVVGG